MERGGRCRPERRAATPANPAAAPLHLQTPPHRPYIRASRVPAAAAAWHSPPTCRSRGHRNAPPAAMPMINNNACVHAQRPSTTRQAPPPQPSSAHIPQMEDLPAGQPPRSSMLSRHFRSRRRQTVTSAAQLEADPYAGAGPARGESKSGMPLPFSPRLLRCRCLPSRRRRNTGSLLAAASSDASTASPAPPPPQPVMIPRRNTNSRILRSTTRVSTRLGERVLGVWVADDKDKACVCAV